MTLTTDLAVALSLGVPLTLLAVGVLAHAYLLIRRPAVVGFEGMDDMLESLAAEPVEELLGELHRELEELRSQLAGQRNTLEHLLSEGPRQTRPVSTPPSALHQQTAQPALRPAHSQATASGRIPRTAPMPTVAPAPASVIGNRGAQAQLDALRDAPRVVEPSPAAGGLRAAVSQLAAEGLSDRAIARRLHVGLEEVRSARLRAAGLAQ